jgi:uncharacterized protein YndB with AHSA1/START domain
VRTYRTKVPFVQYVGMRLTRTYPVPIDDVWAALTVSERLGRWFGTFTGDGPEYLVTITGEVDAGGEIGTPTPATVHECEAPRRLVVEMPEGGVSWTVAVDLATVAAGTVLTFGQELPEGLDEDDIRKGWDWYLDRLGASLTGAPMPAWVG